MNVQAVLFGVCLTFIILCQPLNTWASSNWPLFASANYFTSNGFFVSMVFGIPNILLAIVCIINVIIGTASLAAEVKRMEFANERQKKAAKTK